MSTTADTAEEITRNLGSYLCSDVLGTGEAIDPDLNLLLDGGVDSLGMLKLVAFIEHSYEVKVPPEHFTIANFRSLRVIGNYVQTLLQ